MTLIFESAHFTVDVPAHPHVDRHDGGHIVINPKVTVEDRIMLSPAQAKELMKLTMVAGEAMKTVMNRHGIDLARINYQDNGNWRPEMHIHLYGRALSALKQPYGQALHFPKPEKGYYEGNEALTPEDISALKEEIERLLRTEKYADF